MHLAGFPYDGQKISVESQPNVVFRRICNHFASSLRLKVKFAVNRRWPILFVYGRVGISVCEWVVCFNGGERSICCSALMPEKKTIFISYLSHKGAFQLRVKTPWV